MPLEINRSINTGIHEMTPLFYQHGYEQVKMPLGDLLKIGV